MGKVCTKEKTLRRGRKQNRRLSTRKEYLKPGALAQLRYCRATCAKSSSCTDLGRKRVVVLDSASSKGDGVTSQTPALLLSPQRANSGRLEIVVKTPMTLGMDQSPTLLLSPHRTMSGRSDVMVTTPKTPQLQDRDTDSRLESLPMDILVKILCHLHHDQLRPVFHVSQKIRRAVILARQFHFNYTTPNRERQEMLQTVTPLPTEHWPFFRKGDQKGSWYPSPHTPKAPRHGPRPPRFKAHYEVRQITAALFQEPISTPSRRIPPGLPKSVCKSFASNRALFYEDELCQAVAQNKLL